MPVPVSYRRSSEAVTSYDFFDIASGTGYERFYLGLAQISGSTLKFLTPNVIPSDPSSVSGTVAGAGTPLDYDFDVSFNKPFTIEGELIFSGLFSLKTGGLKGQYLIDVYHVNSAGTETLLGSAEGAEKTGIDEWKACFKVTIARKHLAIGEKLRITTRLRINAGAGDWEVWFDPKNRETVTDGGSIVQTSDAYVDVPFRIDL